KRQVEELTIRAAQDFDEFYEVRAADGGRFEASKTGPILVVTTDAKGVKEATSRTKTCVGQRDEAG
ncbi:MAG: hypothetical protein GY811_24820, partial [Myxococcales bacterium]|nr:hypothetical protein [Myxococcales bacterium]